MFNMFILIIYERNEDYYIGKLNFLLYLIVRYVTVTLYQSITATFKKLAKLACFAFLDRDCVR